MKKVLSVLAVAILILANVSVDVSYSLQVVGYDPSTRHCDTYVDLSTGETLTLREGEAATIQGDVSCTIERRAEAGWHKSTAKSERHVQISLRKLEAVKPELAAIILPMAKKRDSQPVRPDVPVVFPGKVSASFVNDVKGWNFSKAHFLESRGKLLTLDIDFGENCSLSCPHCFRRNGAINASGRPALSYDETMGIIRQAKELGLETVKILGAGEPFENKRFLRFLRDMADIGVQVNVFTKGHVFGDDFLADKFFGLSSAELADEIVKIGTSLNVGCNSFIPEIQDELVGVPGYSEKRNRALELLTRAGMNASQPTRLCIAMVPISEKNIDEIFDMYRWARERNIYPIAAPSMCAGRVRDSWQSICLPLDKLVGLYTRINIYNVEKGIVTLDELREDGISPYAGGCPCHQVACGAYVTSRGIVLRCPGDDVTVFGDVRKESLADIWYKSENFGRQGVFNCHCPPKDGRTIPSGFYDEVLKNVLGHFA